MLYLDRRIGSEHLQSPLERLGIPVELITMNFADAAFLGHGAEGENSVSLGIEIKKIRDLLNSIQDGRLSGHQLPGLLRSYDAVWLIIEGLWRPSPTDGLLELYVRGKWEALALGRRQYLYKEASNYLTTLEMKAGIRIRRTANGEETAHVIADLYRWWNDKAWEQHRSHLSLHRHVEHALLVSPPLRRRIAAELPGIGQDRSGAVAGHFKTTREMLAAGVPEWRAIKGIGGTLAKRITEAIDRE